jgi:hypothetical protein
MGLDGVELVMSIEEGFGITIANAEAEACVTPGAVIDLVLGKLRASDKHVCVSQRAFYLLRKGLRRTLGVSRRKVDLNADIRSFAVGRSDRQVWDDLKTAVQARSWPGLARPGWLTAAMWILSLGTFCALITRLHWTVALGCAALVGYGAFRLTRPFRSRIPAGYSRLRNLVPFAIRARKWDRE